MKFLESCDLFGWVFLSNPLLETIFGKKKLQVVAWDVFFLWIREKRSSVEVKKCLFQ